MCRLVRGLGGVRKCEISGDDSLVMLIHTVRRNHFFLTLQKQKGWLGADPAFAPS